MFNKYIKILFFIIILIFLNCVSASLKTFVSPSIEPGSIHNVAIFPMRNARLLPDEAREINRGISQTFHDQNPDVVMIGPAEAIDLINRAGLSVKYSDFLRDYAASGIPNVNVLKEIGDSLGTDAILQGEVYDIRQIDGAYGITRGIVSVTVRYSMMSTRNGDVLWEATSTARKETGTTLEKAPPLYEAIIVAQEKILTALPTLGK